MAITIVTQPTKYSPVYNDLYYECSSTNSGEPNFIYIFDVYIAGAFFSRHRIQPNPTDGKGYFNSMRIVESSISHDPLTVLNGSQATNLSSFTSSYVTISEIYGTGTTPINTVTSSTILPFNAVFDYLDYLNYNSSTYLLASSASRFLTNGPSTQTIKVGERAWLYSVAETTANYFKRIVKTYNSAGTLLNTYTTNNGLTANVDANRFLRTSSGTLQLTAELTETFTGVSYYTVELQNVSNVLVSEIRRYNIDTNCSKYQDYRIHFLNKLGGFDSFTFTLLSRKDHDITRTSYQKNFGIQKAAINRTVNTSNTTIKDGLVLNSNYVTEAQHEWLIELITSPVIFWDNGTQLIPINCQERKVTQKKVVNDKLFNLTLNFDFNYINHRQRT